MTQRNRVRQRTATRAWEEQEDLHYPTCPIDTRTPQKRLFEEPRGQRDQPRSHYPTCPIDPRTPRQHTFEELHSRYPSVPYRSNNRMFDTDPYEAYEANDTFLDRVLHQEAVRSLLDQPRAMIYEVMPHIRHARHLIPPMPVIAVAIISIAVLVAFGYQEITTTLSGWKGPVNSLAATLSLPKPFKEYAVRAVGDYHLQGASSLSAEDIDAILSSYGSPAAGTGQAWLELGQERNIDPAFALAFFIHESQAGTHPNWAGMKDDGSTTHNVGNIICAGYDTCYGRFRDYDSWEDGIADWYRLIDDEYIKGRGMQTLDEVIPVYAPAFENDVNAYTDAVKQMVDSWRMVKLADLGLSGDTLRPTGNPLNVSETVMTQGYAVGSHAPAHVWGAIDLAIDGDSDGKADPKGTEGKPVYATHSGVVKTKRNSWPAGNHVWVMNHEYKTGYAHLQEFAVVEGQVVNRGDLIGYVGSTGQSSGPHLDYQVWRVESGRWVNKNPLDFGVIVK
jgi:hypothetical protein